MFLTRDGRAPTTAVETAGMWTRLAWSDIAEILDQVWDELIERGNEVDPGPLNYLRTLRIYGGSRRWMMIPRSTCT